MFLVKGMLFFEFARTMLGSGSFIAIFSGIVAQGWPWRYRSDTTMDRSVFFKLLHNDLCSLVAWRLGLVEACKAVTY